MRNEQNETTTSPVSSNEGHSNEGHAHWQVGRLILAVAVCLLIIGAAIAFERFG